MARVRHLFFDLGGTLVDLRGLAPAMSSELVSRYPALEGQAPGVALAWMARTAAATSRALGPAFRPGLVLTTDALSSALADAGVECDSSTAATLVHRATASYLRRAKLYGDVSRSLLQSLRSRVVSMGVVTDSVDSLVRPLLDRFRLGALLDVVVISESIRTYKPDPLIYRAALAQGHADPASSLFVSDSIIDLEGAVKAGMRALWINREGARPEVSPPEGTLAVESLGGLQELLLKGGPP